VTENALARPSARARIAGYLVLILAAVGGLGSLVGIATITLGDDAGQYGLIFLLPWVLGAVAAAIAIGRGLVRGSSSARILSLPALAVPVYVALLHLQGAPLRFPIIIGCGVPLILVVVDLVQSPVVRNQASSP